MGGHNIRHQTISELARTRPASWPEPDTMRALAFLLDTTDRAILLSFGRTFGLAVETVAVTDRIPAAFTQLPDEIQDAIVQLIRTMSEHGVDARSGPVPSVPDRTMRNPRTVVGSKTAPRTEQSKRNT